MMTAFVGAALGTAAIVAALALTRVTRPLPWRAALAVAPLPMLALAASYGVYSFSRLFVPAWVAVASAAAFELTYLGLAVLTGLSADQRRRARAISLGAVGVSVLYNALAGLLHRRPELLTLPGAWGLAADILLAVAHGVPLALVAFFVADLLLHREAAVTADTPAVTVAAPPALEAPAADSALTRRERVAARARAEGVSERTIWRRVKAGAMRLEEL